MIRPTLGNYSLLSEAVCLASALVFLDTRVGEVEVSMDFGKPVLGGKGTSLVVFKGVYCISLFQHPLACFLKQKTDIKSRRLLFDQIEQQCLNICWLLSWFQVKVVVAFEFGSLLSKHNVVVL